MSQRSMYRIIQRDKIMRRDHKQIEEAKRNLLKKGFSLKEATLRIKKAIMKAVKEKIN